MPDEPSLGLAPNLVADAFEKIAQINRDTAVSIRIVEQKVREVLAINHRVHGLKLGKVAFSGIPGELMDGQGEVTGAIPVVAVVDALHCDPDPGGAYGPQGGR